MLAVRDAREGRERLALAARAHDDDLLGRDALQLVSIDEVLVGNVEISQLASDIGVLHHRAACDDNLAAVRARGVANLLHAVDMARKRCDDDTLLRLADDAVQGLTYFGLARRERGLRRVRGVAHHEVDSDFVVARKRTEVEVDAVDRGLVELEVAGVQHVASRALQKHAHGAGNRVVHSEKLRREAAHLHLLAGLDFNELGVLDTVLGELSLDEAERELGRIDGNRAIEILQKVRDRARVVLVAVRDDDAAQLVGVLEHIGVVRQDKVDAGMIVVGEHKARVIDDHVVSAFEHGHVLADGVKTAKRDDLQLGLGILARAR